MSSTSAWLTPSVTKILRVECAYWTDRTAVAQYLTKGRTVYAEGSPEADAYSNKEGQPAATLRMRVQNVQLLSNNSGNEGATPAYSNAGSTSVSSNPVNTPAEMSTTGGDDGLPF